MKFLISLTVLLLIAVLGKGLYETKKIFFYTPFRAGQCIKQKNFDSWETDVYLISSVGKHSYLVSECDSYRCHDPRKTVRLSSTSDYEEMECPDYSQQVQ